MAGTQFDDQRMDQVIGDLLRVAVFVSMTIVAIGGAILLVHYAGERPHYRVFRGEPGDLRSVVGIARLALQGSGKGIVQFGLLVLIATPVARVAFSVAAFAVQRDAAFVLITLFVLATLLYSLLGASA